MPENKAERTEASGPAGCLFAIGLICLPIGAWVQWGFGSFLVTLGFAALVGAALSKLK
jgi:hypothetical protein